MTQKEKPLSTSKFCLDLVVLNGPVTLQMFHFLCWYSWCQNPIWTCTNLFLWFTLSSKLGICFLLRVADTWEEDGLQGSQRYRHCQTQRERDWEGEAGTVIGKGNQYSGTLEALSCGLFNNDCYKPFGIMFSILAATQVSFEYTLFGLIVYRIFS